MPKLSDCIELVGFAFLALAAYTCLGAGAAQFVIGVVLVVVASSMSDGPPRKFKFPKIRRSK